MVTTVFEGSFEWDSEKAASNLEKHGVSFIEAMSVMFDSGAIEEVDSLDPHRVVVTGFSNQARLLVVVTIETSASRIRIISARKATPNEQRKYAVG